MQIVKIVFQDGSFKEVESIKPLDISEDDDMMTKYRKRRKHHSQFEDLESEMLNHIDDDLIEDYAKDTLGLEDEDDFPDTRELSGFDDSELLEEVSDRKLLSSGKSIVTADFLGRFSNIIEKENHIELEKLLTGLEKKLKL